MLNLMKDRVVLRQHERDQQFGQIRLEAAQQAFVLLPLSLIHDN